MKVCKSEQEYIKAIAPAVQKACKRYGYLPSVLIAQSCLENGYGIRDYWDNPQIEELLKYNNMVGIKAELLTDSWRKKSVWNGLKLRKTTPEEYNNVIVPIKDDFRKYDNIEQSFADYLLFMKYGSNYGEGGVPKYGDEVLSIKNPEKLIRTVRSRGYATGSTYDINVMKILREHNLTKYDDLSKVTATKYTPGYREDKKTVSTGSIGTWQIKKSPGYNKGVPLRGNEKKYIAVHYLGVDGENNELWNNGYGAHYVVYWDGTIYQVCDHDAITWQVGTSGGVYKQKHPYARNSNCIGIEMCCHNTDGYCPETPTGEKHWYFTEATQKATAWLVRKLMKDLSIDISHVLRHYDVVNKTCPAPYVYNNKYKGSWTWSEFMQAVKTGKCPTSNATSEPQKASQTVQKEAISVNMRVLHKGCRGDDVKVWQIICGANPDGDFGEKTLDATVNFQTAHGLDGDGYVGKKTWTKGLNSIS